MKHLGDTNKMVDTPRTDGCLEAILDAYGYVHQGNCPQRWVNHARELERELNAANDRIHRASMAFFRDGSDGQVASQMLQILEEERGKP